MGDSVAHSPACATAIRPCLQCKLKGWADGSSSLGVAIPEGWKGSSRFELERQHVQELTDAGVGFERASK